MLGDPLKAHSSKMDSFLIFNWQKIGDFPESKNLSASRTGAEESLWRFGFCVAALDAEISAGKGVGERNIWFGYRIMCCPVWEPAFPFFWT